VTKISKGVNIACECIKKIKLDLERRKPAGVSVPRKTCI